MKDATRWPVLLGFAYLLPHKVSARGTPSY
jgi:hypothetical protein